MDPIQLLKSMLAGLAAGLGTMYAPELNPAARSPSNDPYPPGARVAPNRDPHGRPPLRLPEQLRGSVAP